MSVIAAPIYAGNQAEAPDMAASALLAASAPVKAEQPGGGAAAQPAEAAPQAKTPAKPAIAGGAAGQARQESGAAKGSTAPAQPAAQSNAGHPAAANTGHSVAPKAPFPPFDSSYFASHILWLAICFGFFYFFIARIILPRIGSVIETRRDRIAADLDQAARMKTEADAAVETYQKNLSEARNQAKIIAFTATEDAKTRAEIERKAFETALEEKLAKAEEGMAAYCDRILTGIDTIAGEAAADIVRKISGKKADKAAVAQAIAAAGSSGTGSAPL